MNPLAVSVVIASRGRPEPLLRCLRGLSQLLYPRFEIVVVADPAGADAARAAGWADRTSLLVCDEANISVARNLGIRAAAGEVVAFIDDDAVPEPTWLSFLVAPFADPQVAAAGGPVRGRNGISWQWRAREILANGESLPLALPDDRVTRVTGQRGRGLKTEGTNMAFRRTVLSAAGGFDPAFRFYLDEADLNLRLAAQGAVAAFVPRAEVHHGYLPSRRRRADRVPTDLTEIGASLAAFLLRHAPGADADAALGAEGAAQRRRLLAHMIAGRIEPRDVGRRLSELAAGWAEGRRRAPRPLAPLGAPERAFRPFVPSSPLREATVLAGGRRDHASLLREAEDAARRGFRPSVFILSRTARYHAIRFEEAGFWLQQGGLHGRAERTEPLWEVWRFEDRLHSLVSRIRTVRALCSVDDEPHQDKAC